MLRFAREVILHGSAGEPAVTELAERIGVRGVIELLRSRDAALVIGDHPERRFQTFERTARWRYVRFHRGTRGRGGNYSERELERWAERLHEWRAAGEVYAYFNNDWSAYAPRNARWLAARLAEQAGERD